jgi:hypothetical protein
MGPTCWVREVWAKISPSHRDSVSLLTVALAGPNQQGGTKSCKRQHRIQQGCVIVQLVARPIYPGEKKSAMASEFELAYIGADRSRLVQGGCQGARGAHPV